MIKTTIHARPLSCAFVAAVTSIAACGGSGSTPSGFSGAGADSGVTTIPFDGSMSLSNDATSSFGDATSSQDVSSGCASATFQAQGVPAAMLIALDVSGTMAMSNKYAYAQQAIVQSIDQDAFDTMSLGLLGYPQGTTPAPACLASASFGFITSVACGVPGIPQVAIALAGTNKSNDTSGVRHDMYSWLTSNAPQQSNGDGNPTYDALKSSITALQNLTLNGARILLYITDGGASCASVSSPTRAGYDDGNDCPDWEEPASIISLLAAANTNATAPIHTFVVGVPGANTNAGNVDNPPYSVKLALSAYAAAGSPDTIDPTCTGMTFTQGGSDPTKPCHFDMSSNYTAAELTSAIGQIRGQVLGCVFALPTPDGGTIDPGNVNVDYNVGGTTVDLERRSNASDTCTSDGCWDYTSSGQVQLIGKACDDVQTSTTAAVSIVVGCKTIVK